jgi:hypothetical protein
VSRVLAGRLNSVVATGAATGQRRVIHVGDYRPVRGYVAVRALTGSRNVVGRLRRCAK